MCGCHNQGTIGQGGVVCGVGVHEEWADSHKPQSQAHRHRLTYWQSPWKKDRLLWRCASTVFTSKWPTVWHHGVEDALLNTHLLYFSSPTAMGEQRSSLETPTCRTGDRPEFVGRSSQKTAPKRPLLDTKFAIECARRLETAQNLFVLIRICSTAVLSSLNAGFEPRCPRIDFLLACCCCCCCVLLVVVAAVKMCCSS